MAGLISKTPYDKYQIYFFNENTKIQKSLGNFDTEEEAINKLNDFEIKFYSENKQHLPKGVSIIGKTFNLQIRSNTIRRGRHTKNIGSTKILADMKKLKLTVIESLMG